VSADVGLDMKAVFIPQKVSKQPIYSCSFCGDGILPEKDFFYIDLSSLLVDSLIGRAMRFSDFDITSVFSDFGSGVSVEFHGGDYGTKVSPQILAHSGEQKRKVLLISCAVKHSL
jgi:hypothetical protein